MTNVAVLGAVFDQQGFRVHQLQLKKYLYNVMILSRLCFNNCKQSVYFSTSNNYCAIFVSICYALWPVYKVCSEQTECLCHLIFERYTVSASVTWHDIVFSVREYFFQTFLRKDDTTIHSSSILYEIKRDRYDFLIYTIRNINHSDALSL